MIMTHCFLAVHHCGVVCIASVNDVNSSSIVKLNLTPCCVDRPTAVVHQISQGYMPSYRILMWSFALAPALLAVCISQFYFCDGFDISSVLLHLALPWLILSPSPTWLSVSIVICFELIKSNKVGDAVWGCDNEWQMIHLLKPVALHL